MKLDILDINTLLRSRHVRNDDRIVSFPKFRCRDTAFVGVDVAGMLEMDLLIQICQSANSFGEAIISWHRRVVG